MAQWSVIIKATAVIPNAWCFPVRRVRVRERKCERGSGSERASERER